ncbi:hypothetical protein ACQKO5_06000 [Novosphingobium subterraneum]|uniref:hypothetical protein n=1 Tax=Novosphingobium subterraneum TaxID=48936 RepID=UPI003D02CC3D
MSGEPSLPFSPPQIDRVTFFKRDEITTDLICCEVVVSGQIHFFHEECAEWRALLNSFCDLTGFDDNWFAKVQCPPFQACETVAFVRR